MAKRKSKSVKKPALRKLRIKMVAVDPPLPDNPLEPGNPEDNFPLSIFFALAITALTLCAAYLMAERVDAMNDRAEQRALYTKPISQTFP